MITGIGNDIVEIERIADVYHRNEGFVRRILTETEQKFLINKSPERRIEFLAGRFAAKEAMAKALGTGIGSKLSFLDMEILPDESGKPILVLNQQVYKKELIQANTRIHLSISHSRLFAIAHVVIEQV